MNEAATNVHEQVSARTQVLHTLDGHSGMGLLDRVVMTLSSEWKSLSRVQLFVTPWTVQSMEISRPEYWRGEPFPSPGDLTNPGVEPRSPALQADSLPTELSGKPHIKVKTHTEKGMTTRFKKIPSLSFSLPNLY